MLVEMSRTPGNGFDDLADEALHLLRVGSHGVDVELVFGR